MAKKSMWPLRRFFTRTDPNAIGEALGIGVIAGLRSMTAPAVVSWAATRNWIRPSSDSLAFLSKQAVASVLSVLAVGELVVDKLPGTPNRTQSFALAVRALTGALSGAALWPNRRGVATGAVLGAAGAIAGAFVGYETRRRLHNNLQISDTVVALAEDVFAVGGGVLLVCGTND